ncbi:unnamed protein product [Xylocopa violacea]|uniref:Uncharacterized protein n=1 Tax=Xylocopa violacea TaxID=135666 RepID=A0ABP1NH80_XYLVO
MNDSKKRFVEQVSREPYCDSGAIDVGPKNKTTRVRAPRLTQLRNSPSFSRRWINGRGASYRCPNRFSGRTCRVKRVFSAHLEKLQVRRRKHLRVNGDKRKREGGIDVATKPRALTFFTRTKWKLQRQIDMDIRFNARGNENTKSMEIKDEENRVINCNPLFCTIVW